jgi:hypothetical protein
MRGRHGSGHTQQALIDVVFHPNRDGDQPRGEGSENRQDRPRKYSRWRHSKEEVVRQD